MTREFKYYYTHGDNYFGVIKEEKGVAYVRSLSDGRSLKIDMDWIQKGIESGKIDMSIKKERLD